MYVLKDPILQKNLLQNEYNGLVEFFISTLILNSKDLQTDIKGIDLTCCSLSTSILFFEQLLTQFGAVSSYEECDQLMTSFANSYSFSSPEELVIFFNYIIETEKTCHNPNFESILEVFIERVFAVACKKHSVTPV